MLFFNILGAGLAQPARKNVVFYPCGVFQTVKVIINGEPLSTPGIIYNQRAYLPARLTLMDLGGNVTWVAKERTFYAQFPSQKTIIKVDVQSPVITIYQYDPDAQYGVGEQIRAVNVGLPYRCGRQYYLPIRATSEATGAVVKYDQSQRILYVTASEKTISEQAR